LLAGILVAGASCAGGQIDRNLHVNDIQVIGTHNSYKQPLPPEELAAHRAHDAAGADSIDYGFPPLTAQLDAGVRQRDADTPFSGVKFWEHLLDEGYQLTALGGSDNHDALSGTIGTPTTVIYADMLSQAGIVAAIRRGRVFIDVAGTRDRSLDLMATVGGQTAHMGDALRVSRGARVRFEGSVSGVAGGDLEVILDGQRTSLLKGSHVAATTQSFEFPWRADGKRHWIRVNVRDGQSHLALIGNPIYLR